MAQSVVEDKQDLQTMAVYVKDQSEGELGVHHNAIGCSNPNCRRTTIRLVIGLRKYNNNKNCWLVREDGILFNQYALPQGFAKPQPNYVPKALVEDYTEACLIRDLSPKASATLIRRCLQGMIRDFAKISKSRLIDEIKELRKAVDDGTADRAISIESVDAIDAVRDIGNIGAHMERDINEIIEVDPGEAQALIELVEMLFDEWYGASAKRQARLERVKNIAGEKSAIKATIGAEGAAPPAQLNVLLAIAGGEALAKASEEESQN
jgi:hypothetical protein